MKAIIITSIFDPTEAVEKFAKKTDYKVYVVGDKKTPSNWNCSGVNHISVDHQQNSNYYLSKVLPYNHYCRKMLGYLEAIKDKAEVIYDTDDDNIPYENWNFPDFIGNFDNLNQEGFINIYQLFTEHKIWPRGLPLRLINKDFQFEENIVNKLSSVGSKV